MKKIISYKEFLLNESNIQEAYNELLESEVNYKSDKFALVFIGGSIGQRAVTPIFVKGQIGSVSETGNDKEALKEKADRLRKQLSAGERKYYRMNYTVIELTPSKVKEIEYLISKQQSSANESEEVNEKRVSFKGKTVNDLYRIVKDDSNSMVFANGKLYSILDPEEMMHDLKNDSTYVYDKDGGEHEVKIADIEFIEIN